MRSMPLPRLAPPAALAVLLGAPGCVPASDEVALLVPGEVDVAWDARFDAPDDGRVALVPIDVMVYGAASGAPIANAPVRVAVAGPHAGVVAPEAVAWLDADDTDAGEALFAPVWDAWRDRYAVLAEDPATWRDLRTDTDGIARLYVWVDRFDTDVDAVGGGAGSNLVAVVVSTGDVEDSFILAAR